MSNGNVYERLWKLITMASRLVLDGKRSAEELCELLQRFIEKAVFNPTAFIGKGWAYDEPRDVRSAALGKVDYRKVKLSADWLRGGGSLGGEERHTRIIADTTAVPLNCDHFLDLWNNKEKIPEEWKKVAYITFDGDIFRSPDGSRSVLDLYWRGGKWHWHYYWLGHGFHAGFRAAVLAK
jgi:hypothetical protein